jgi:hypothetical protein
MGNITMSSHLCIDKSVISLSHLNSSRIILSILILNFSCALYLYDTLSIHKRTLPTEYTFQYAANRNSEYASMRGYN